MDRWITDNTHDYVRKGSKRSRRTTVNRMIDIANNIKAHEHGVKLPPQIGKAHIHRYYARHKHLSPRTLQDHYYAIKHLWELLERTKLPPKPPSMHENEEG